MSAKPFLRLSMFWGVPLSSSYIEKTESRCAGIEIGVDFNVGEAVFKAFNVLGFIAGKGSRVDASMCGCRREGRYRS